MQSAATAPLMEPRKVLKEFFGFDGFKGNQEAVVNSILAGEDCFVIMRRDESRLYGACFDSDY